jgi:hypothetical protein
VPEDSGVRVNLITDSSRSCYGYFNCSIVRQGMPGGSDEIPAAIGGTALSAGFQPVHNHCEGGSTCMVDRAMKGENVYNSCGTVWLKIWNLINSLIQLKGACGSLIFRIDIEGFHMYISESLRVYGLPWVTKLIDKKYPSKLFVFTVYTCIIACSSRVSLSQRL